MDDHHMDWSSVETAAVIARFEGVVSLWALSENEVCRLLGVQGAFWRESLASRDVEAAMRMVIDVAALLGMVVGHDDLSAWLRAPNDAFVDRLSPLGAMALGRHAIRGIRNVLLDLSGTTR